MCLIIAGPSGKIRSTLMGNPNMTRDIFSGNSDGFGVMYANKSGLKVIKVLPKSNADVEAVIANLPRDDRNLALHWRMKTHGDIHLSNCHPYDVVPGKVALMHNGVLHTGNSRDRTRSDTYHFIQDFLADTVAASPAVIHTEGFKSLIGDYIAENRFVIMDEAGDMAIVNRDQGIEHDGIWFANEYAWSPEMLIPGYADKWARYYSKYAPTGGGSSTGTALTPWRSQGTVYAGGVYADEYEDEYDPVGKPWGGVGTVGTKSWGPNMQAKFIEAVIYSSVDDTADILEDYPATALRALFAAYKPSLTKHLRDNKDKVKDLTDSAVAMISAVLGCDIEALARECKDTPGIVAEALCYNCDWEPRPGTVDDDLFDDEDDLDIQNEIDEDDAQPISEYQMRYLQHSVKCDYTATDDWCYLIEDSSGTYIAGDTGYPSLQAARDAARGLLDQNVGVDYQVTAELDGTH